ncbi:MAG TPA: hypothetical protein PKJ75_03825 [Methanosarcina vacuolata]|nr:hypothetical protein [Methanosarcina vacuolata]HPS89362.1 hypothetical protein [Methanosarcina vacuolata]
MLKVLVLPEFPLHNNVAELAARAKVRKRDVSFQTITEKGTKANDTFMTIVQAAKRLGVNTYQYICDRFYVIDSPTNSRYHLWRLWINSSEKKVH